MCWIRPPRRLRSRKRSQKRRRKPAAAAEKEKAKPGLLESLARALTADAKTAGAARPAGKAIAYSRLHFDLNHNGDLTDDKVIESESAGGMAIAAELRLLPIPGGDGGGRGGRREVRLRLHDERQQPGPAGGMVYAYASLNAAAYREGEITLDGKKHRVALIDFNSNGRFDDQIKIRDEVASRDGEVYAAYGDILVLDPETNPRVYVNPYDVTASTNRHQVSKLLNIEGKYYDLKISPAGDQLSLTPSAVAARLGHQSQRGFHGRRLRRPGVRQNPRREVAAGRAARGRLEAAELHARSDARPQAETQAGGETGGGGRQGPESRDFIERAPGRLGSGVGGRRRGGRPTKRPA